MDESLSELERRAAANPADAVTAARLDRSMLRAGQDEAVAQRYRFKFRCPLRFEDLAMGADPLKRDCKRCSRTVHLVRTPAELADRVAVGDCVAFSKGSLAAACVDLAKDPRVHSAEQVGRPCLQDADTPFVDLDTFEISPLTLKRFPGVFARTYEVVPVSWVERRQLLHVCCANTSSVATTLDDLRFMLNTRVELALAAPEAVQRAIDRYYPPGEDPHGEFMMMGDVTGY